MPKVVYGVWGRDWFVEIGLQIDRQKIRDAEERKMVLGVLKGLRNL